MSVTQVRHLVSRHKDTNYFSFRNGLLALFNKKVQICNDWLVVAECERFVVHLV